MDLDWKSYDYMRFTVADIYGIARSKTLPKRVFEQCKTNGIPMYCGALGFSMNGGVLPELKELNEINQGNLTMMPDLSTLHPLPLSSTERYRVGEVLCETEYQGIQKTPCTRQIARTQLEQLKQLGYKLRSGFEVELMFIDPTNEKPVFDSSRDGFSSKAWEVMERVILDSDQTLSEMGVLLGAMHSEYIPGQYEVTLVPQDGIKTADDVTLVKDTIKSVAEKHNKQAVFMGMPFERFGVATGMHFTHSLKSLDDKDCVFYDATRSRNMSDVAEFWLGGLTKHADALAALSSPTVNCFRRMAKVFAPVYNDWGVDDRTVTFRVKNNSPEETCVESRLPTSAANPYIVMAATIAAGIDGIRKKIACPPPKSESQKPAELPRDLESGLVALENDSELKSALGQVFIEWFCTLKRWEIAKIKDVAYGATMDDVYAKEREMYMAL